MSPGEFEAMATTWNTEATKAPPGAVPARRALKAV
jgi:hypothetical protein